MFNTALAQMPSGQLTLPQLNYLFLDMIKREASTNIDNAIVRFGVTREVAETLRTTTHERMMDVSNSVEVSLFKPRLDISLKHCLNYEKNGVDKRLTELHIMMMLPTDMQASR